MSERKTVCQNVFLLQQQNTQRRLSTNYEYIYQIHSQPYLSVINITTNYKHSQPIPSRFIIVHTFLVYTYWHQHTFLVYTYWHQQVLFLDQHSHVTPKILSFFHTMHVKYQHNLLQPKTVEDRKKERREGGRKRERKREEKEAEREKERKKERRQKDRKKERREGGRKTDRKTERSEKKHVD